MPLYVHTSMDILLLIQKCLENHLKWDFCIYSVPTPFFLGVRLENQSLIQYELISL